MMSLPPERSSQGTSTPSRLAKANLTQFLPQSSRLPLPQSTSSDLLHDIHGDMLHSSSKANVLPAHAGMPCPQRRLKTSSNTQVQVTVNSNSVIMPTIRGVGSGNKVIAVTTGVSLEHIVLTSTSGSKFTDSRPSLTKATLNINAAATGPYGSQPPICGPKSRLPVNSLHQESPLPDLNFRKIDHKAPTGNVDRALLDIPQAYANSSDEDALESVAKRARCRFLAEKKAAKANERLKVKKYLDSPPAFGDSSDGETLESVAKQARSSFLAEKKAAEDTIKKTVKNDFDRTIVTRDTKEIGNGIKPSPPTTPNEGRSLKPFPSQKPMSLGQFANRGRLEGKGNLDRTQWPKSDIGSIASKPPTNGSSLARPSGAKALPRSLEDGRQRQELLRLQQKRRFADKEKKRAAERNRKRAEDIRLNTGVFALTAVNAGGYKQIKGVDTAEQVRRASHIAGQISLPSPVQPGPSRLIHQVPVRAKKGAPRTILRLDQPSKGGGLAGRLETAMGNISGHLEGGDSRAGINSDKRNNSVIKTERSVRVAALDIARLNVVTPQILDRSANKCVQTPPVPDPSMVPAIPLSSFAQRGDSEEDESDDSKDGAKVSIAHPQPTTSRQSPVARATSIGLSLPEDNRISKTTDGERNFSPTLHARRNEPKKNPGLSISPPRTPSNHTFYRYHLLFCQRPCLATRGDNHLRCRKPPLDLNLGSYLSIADAEAAARRELFARFPSPRQANRNAIRHDPPYPSHSQGRRTPFDPEIGPYTSLIIGRDAVSGMKTFVGSTPHGDIAVSIRRELCTSPADPRPHAHSHGWLPREVWGVWEAEIILGSLGEGREDCEEVGGCTRRRELVGLWTTQSEANIAAHQTLQRRVERLLRASVERQSEAGDVETNDSDHQGEVMEILREGKEVLAEVDRIAARAEAELMQGIVSPQWEETDKGKGCYRMEFEVEHEGGGTSGRTTEWRVWVEGVVLEGVKN